MPSAGCAWVFMCVREWVCVCLSVRAETWAVHPVLPFNCSFASFYFVMPMELIWFTLNGNTCLTISSNLINILTVSFLLAGEYWNRLEVIWRCETPLSFAGEYHKVQSSTKLQTQKISKEQEAKVQVRNAIRPSITIAGILYNRSDWCFLRDEVKLFK